MLIRTARGNPNPVVPNVDFRETQGSFFGVNIDPYNCVTLTVYKWNQMDPNGSIWFHLYPVRVKG